MGKILALDVGDQWVGSALSDASKILAKPYKTVVRDELYTFLNTVVKAEKLEAIIIGYPKTMKGTISQQTQKIIDLHQELETTMPQIPFILWDERLSSKRADVLSKARTPEEKRMSHSRAAAFILDSYLGYLLHQKSMQETENQ